MMSKLESIYFVEWACTAHPGFTLSRRGYTQARWDWRKHKRDMVRNRFAKEMSSNPIIEALYVDA